MKKKETKPCKKCVTGEMEAKAHVDQLDGQELKTYECGNCGDIDMIPLGQTHRIYFDNNFVLPEIINEPVA